MTILFDDLLPSFSTLHNSAFVESLVLRGKKTESTHFWQFHLNRSFFHSNGFDVNGINDNWMMQGQDYTVDEASLPSLTSIIFYEWPKMYVVWRYLDGRWRLNDLPVLAAFPWFLCPIWLTGDSRHSNW